MCSCKEKGYDRGLRKGYDQGYADTEREFKEDIQVAWTAVNDALEIARRTLYELMNPTGKVPVEDAICNIRELIYNLERV